MDECRGSCLEKGEEKAKRGITRNLSTEMVRFCASSPGPGELAKKTSKWDLLPAFIANNHTSLTISMISVSLALSRVTTSAHVNQLNEWIRLLSENCTLSLPASLPTVPPSWSLTRTLPFLQMMSTRKDCWLIWNIGILSNEDITLELYVQKSFLCLALPMEAVANQETLTQNLRAGWEREERVGRGLLALHLIVY